MAHRHTHTRTHMHAHTKHITQGTHMYAYLHRYAHTSTHMHTHGILHLTTMLKDTGNSIRAMATCRMKK